MVEKLSNASVEDLLANDTGARVPLNLAGKIIVVVAIIWSLFQIYYASPFPYTLQNWINHLGWLDLNVVVDDTRARSIHLSFAVFLAFLSYPAFKTSPKKYIPIQDWILAAVGVFCTSYYLFFYDGLVQRVGAPNMQDIIVGSIGILILLEATRRTLGLALVVIAALFLLYNYVGQFFPIGWIVSHDSGTLADIANQQWITTEGVFGVALGVSTKYVFLFVLFGALLDRAGAGNYFIKTAFAYLGHLKGGPAKAAVVASGLTGIISGSSIANVVTTGTFTIPMMKRVGFSKEKAGAVEVASSVNGQIMPPVMGAAAFLMIEYIDMPYSELLTHAFLPAVISYIALFYIVHLEACKQNFVGLERTDKANPFLITLLKALSAFITLCIVYFVLKIGLSWIKTVFPDQSFLIICGLLFVAYIALLARVAKFPDLVLDDPNEEITKSPSVKPTINSGLHYFLPVVVLIWALMIERLSPGLSAFWGTLTLIFIQITQHVIIAFFRKSGQYWANFKVGLTDLKLGLEIGAKNMIAIGIATATAGIIVGVVSLTGFGAQLSNIIGTLSMGNIFLMLIMVAVFSLILGMGLPTTANYIVVSSLMAGVIVEIGQQNGLVVPLIAVHLFVFYFGIMADVTPPVGLASFAASAISGGDPIKTGLVAFFYSLRTALLPFIFIFNTDLLLIDVGILHGVLIFIISTIAMLAFTAATMGWFFRKNTLIDTAILLLATALLFRPGFFMDFISPSQLQVAPAEIAQLVGDVPEGTKLKVHVSGIDQYGNPVKFYTQLPIANGATSEARFDAMGFSLTENKEGQYLVDNLGYDSEAQKVGLDWDQEVLGASIENHRALSKYWMYVPGILLLMLLALWQKRSIKTRKTEV